MDIASLLVFVLGVLVLPLIFLKFINIELVRKKPIYASITAAFFVLFGFIVAFFIFSSELSIAMLAFTSLLILPFIIKILEPEKIEGERKTKIKTKTKLYDWFSPSNLSIILKRHDKLIKFYIFLFFGMALEYTLLFAVLAPPLGESAFEHQLSLLGPGGRFEMSGLFYDIISNNLQIVIISFILSIFFGAGSIFILNYNASIVGMLYGSPIRTLIYGGTAFASIIFYLPHTILEILAYLLAAVAGGILSSCLIEMKKDMKKNVVRDACVIFILAVLLIFIAGYIEITVLFMFK